MTYHPNQRQCRHRLALLHLILLLVASLTASLGCVRAADDFPVVSSLGTVSRQASGATVVAGKVYDVDGKGQSINVREQPGTSYRILAQLKHNTDVSVVGRNQDASWLRIREPVSGLQGWVSARYVLLGGDSSRLPVSVQPGSVAPVTPVVKATGRELIAYIGTDANVWLVSPDGTGARQITRDATLTEPVPKYFRPVWAPDGTRLYLLRQRGQDGDLCVYDLKTQSIQPLGPSEQDIYSVAASRDGQYLMYAFAVPQPAPCLYDSSSCLARLDLATGASTTVKCEPCEGWGYAGLIFAPDGRQLAMTLVGYEHFGIGLYTIGGSEVGYFDNGGNCSDAAYAADGTTLWADCADEYMGVRGLHVLGVSRPTRTRVMDLAVRLSGISASPDGSSLALGFWDDYRVADDREEIHILDLATMKARKLAVGSYPAWQPVGLGPDVHEWLARKTAAIERMKTTRVEAFLIPWPVEAFDERDAAALTIRLESLANAGQVSVDQVEAFARLTVQEEGLADMMELYVGTCADLVEVTVDAAGLLMGLAAQCKNAAARCTQSGSKAAGPCAALHKTTNAMILGIARSFKDLLIATAPDTEEADATGTFWSLVTDAISLNIDEGAAVEDLLGTAVKGPAVAFWVKRYVDELQPTLNQGVRSADPASAGLAGTWKVEGTLYGAEQQVDHLRMQSANRAEEAHYKHGRLLVGAKAYQMATEVAELGTLSGKAALLKAGSILFQIAHGTADYFAIRASMKAMECIRTSSLRAGELAFNPEQLIRDCLDE